MNIKRAKQEIKDTVEAYLLKDEYGAYVIPPVHQRPILLMGPPGIGKTQIMEQVAEECGIGLVSYTITHHTRQSAIGLPFISHKEFQGREYAMTEYTMSEIIASVYEKMEATGCRQGILFIDEINCVSETLAPAMLQFLQCKTFGTHKVPEGWIIAAAGNPPEYNKSVREFDIVTMDRVKKIMVEADFAAWKEYAYGAGIHPAVMGYLNARQKNFYIMENTIDGRMFATPRGWEDVSRLLEVYDTMGRTMDSQVVEQYIQHPRTAKDFANYLELYRKYQVDYQIEAVLKGQIDPILLKKSAHASLDERFSVVSLLLAGLNQQFMKVIRQEGFMEQMRDALKTYHQRMGQLKQILEEKEAAWAIKLEHGSVSREEAFITRKLLEELGKAAVKEEAEPAACMEVLRGSFLAFSEELEGMQETAGQMLEYAWDFLEAAYGEGQEIAIFLTELNAGYYSLKFLEEYECERYDRYNQNFLFDDRRAGMLQRMEQLEKRLI